MMLDQFLFGRDALPRVPLFWGCAATQPYREMFFRDANTGAGHDFTGLAAAVQLRLRVAVGLQALQRCSGLLNRGARGSTVATHQFEQVGWWESEQVSNESPRPSRFLTLPLSHLPPVSPTWLSSDSSSFVNCQGNLTRVRVSPSAPL